MSKKKVGIIIGVIAAAVVAAGVGFYFLKGRSSGGNSADKVYVEKVSAIMNQSAGVNNRYSGVVEPQETLEINRDSERKVKEVYVSVGDEVEEGTVLFSYDTEDLQMQIDQAKLEMEGIANDISNSNAPIAELQKEKASAPEDQQFEYTTQIQTLQTSIKQSEYNKKSKQAEIDKYQKSIDNSEVTSKMAGVVKEINENGVDSNGNTAAYMKILATGEYRVKGTIDETSVGTISEGTPVILRSRLDDTQTWTGSISKIDTESTQTDSNSAYMYDGSSSGDSASKYSFYVTLDSTDGLMLGQHLYIEPDYGQGTAEEKEGLWLYDYYIVQDDGDPYVWAADKKNRLEKRKVELGEYDENLGEYEIKSGLSEDDLIAFPMQGLYEGVAAVTNMEEVDYSSPLYNQESTDDSGMDEGMYDEAGTEYMDEGMYNTDGTEYMDEGMYDEAGTEFTDSGESGATDSEVVE